MIALDLKWTQLSSSHNLQVMIHTFRQGPGLSLSSIPNSICGTCGDCHWNHSRLVRVSFALVLPSWCKSYNSALLNPNRSPAVTFRWMAVEEELHGFCLKDRVKLLCVHCVCDILLVFVLGLNKQ